MTAYVKAIATNWKKEGAAWHKKDLENPPILEGCTVTEAMKLCKIDGVGVIKAPIYMEIGEKRVNSDKFGIILSDVPWTEDGYQVLDRQVDWCELLSNQDYAEILDPLTEQYEVGSVLHCGPRGQVLAIQFVLPDYEVAGMERERHTTRLLVGEDRESGKKYFSVVTTRVVCSNTWAAATRGIKTMPNSKHAKNMLLFRRSLEEQTIKTRKEFYENMERLFKTRVAKSDVDKVVATLFPVPNKPKFLQMTEDARNQGYDFNADNDIAKFASKREHEKQRDYDRAMGRNEEYMQAFFTAYEQFNDEQPYAAQTAYALWNASTNVQKPDSAIYARAQQDIAEYNLLFNGDRAKQLDSVYSLLTK